MEKLNINYSPLNWASSGVDTMLPNYEAVDRLDTFCTGLMTFCHNTQNKFRQIKKAHNKVEYTWTAEFNLISNQIDQATSKVIRTANYFYGFIA